jgi:hypothetical protein
MSTQRERQKSEKSPRAVMSRDSESVARRSMGGEHPKRMGEDIPTRIAERAYALYVERGCREGRALDDWLEAEREILGQAVYS